MHNLPEDVKTGDIFYRVTLHYPDYRKEKFEFAYTAYVIILGKTLQPYFIHLGAVNIGYNYVIILGKTLQPYFIHLGAVNIGYNLFPKDPELNK